jgi:surface protein
MFMNCNNLVTIYASDEWSTQYTMAHSGMFTGCTSLVGGMGTTYDPNHVDKTYAHIDGGPSNPGYFTDPAVPSEPEAYACFTPSDSSLTFYFDSRRRFRSGTTYDLNTGLVQPDWLQLGTSVSHVVFDASFAEARPTTTFSWFESMSNLVSIAGINYLNTEDVTIMASMFTECSALTSLDVSHFNTDKVTDMNGMFISCIGLTSLDVSNFNTENVTDMNNMFGNCRGLTSLDLSNFTTETVNNMRYMFYYCNNLTTIYVGNGWSTASVTNSDKMFYRCTKLVGGNGTTYDSSHINADYAHIDGGPSNPGYFTGKVDYMPSDVNGDGKTTIADVTALINYLLSGEPTAGSGDVNGDSKVTIADVTALINLLLSGS